MLDAALASFGTAGFAGTSLDDLASGLGIRKQTILYHYVSKRGLLGAVVDRSAADLNAALLEVLDGERHEDVRTGPYRFFQYRYTLRVINETSFGEDIEIHAKEILKIKGQLNSLLAHHTGQPLERLEKDTDRDNFMGAEEAQEYGIVDAVLRQRPV